MLQKRGFSVLRKEKLKPPNPRLVKAQDRGFLGAENGTSLPNPSSGRELHIAQISVHRARVQGNGAAAPWQPHGPVKEMGRSTTGALL